MLCHDTSRILIGHSEFDHVAIEIIGTAGENWFSADVRIACGIWRGVFRWQFYKGELHQFANELGQLYQTLSGTAKLIPMEPNLELEMTGDGKGHIIVKGKAIAEFGTGTYLVFRLELDQTELPTIVKSLSAADP
jgi:hypothetical protein